MEINSVGVVFDNCCVLMGRSVIIYKTVYYVGDMFMVNYNKLLKKLEEKGINSYVIRKKGIIPQSTLTKFKMCSGTTEEIKDKLEAYKADPKHKGKDFMYDVSTKTIEDLCQLLQCQPQEIMDWEVELDPELSYENRYQETE
jgi:hypothetical protein